jgi:hypothetical protein
MPPNFEVFSRQILPHTANPAITFDRGGGIRLNSGAMDALGRCRMVEILVDREAQILGLRPRPDAGDDATTLYKISTNSAHHGGSMGAKALFAYLGISPYAPGAQRVAAHVEDGILCASYADVKRADSTEAPL